MLVLGAKLGQKLVFLTEDHLLEDWYPTVSISCACGKQSAILQSSSCRSSQVNTSLTYKMPKFSSQRRKKRKFYGNRFTSRQGVNEEGLVPVESTSSGSAMSSSHGQEEAKECSASYQKLVTNAEDEKPKPKVHDKYSEEGSPTITGFRFFDMEVLSSVFEQLRCGDCGSFSLLLMEDSTKRKGCASTLRLLCEHCGWKFSFCTSRKQGKSYEVNRRLVYGMRTIGKGYAGARKFCAIMNMPSPPTEKAFIFNSQVIGRHVKIIQKRV